MLSDLERLSLSSSKMAINHYYYLDASCGERFQVIFERAQSFAGRALQRLDDPGDLQFAEVFERIFKTPVTDSEPMIRCHRFEPTPAQNRKEELRPRSVLAHVRRELHSFAYTWARTAVRAEAEVRIHWDGMGRYVHLRPEVFFDPVNYLVRNHGKEDMEELFNDCTASVMVDHPVELRLTPEDHNPQRVVIDFTEKAREKEIQWEACQVARLAGHHIDSVSDNLLESTIIHEMMHCKAYRLFDYPGDNGATSGWRLLTGLTKAQSYVCAESFAMLCLAAGLADLNPSDLAWGYKYTISDAGRIIGYVDENELMS